TDETEFGGGPEDDVLGEPAEVHGDDGRRGAELEGEIAIRDGIHGVLGDLRPSARVDEAEFAGDELTIDGEGCCGQSSGAEGTDIGAATAVREPVAIPTEHLHISEEVVG